MPEATQPRDGFTIFRAADAPGLMEAGCMAVEPFSPVQRAGMDAALAAGFLEGDEVKVLVNIPGFSLTHVWFKKGYPLPLHSHDADCLYYIIAGGVRLGTEDLGARDSFFIPAGVPYTYRPGENGVELLEFRQANNFNFLNLAKGETFWTKAAATCEANRADWRTAERPTLNA
ncbi:cupin domain-containing protein [Sphingomonas solaris]|uniref:Cupin domain-containing protein n=1 Tax=Alterirhizorhabdus solaris TaxID=2529389 RepID=A0A558RBA8_9SPHN|nr:cupin domain-containing protein [Sphingomonas solaris]TVV76727.1 cupin domain-containing protein [Sphingomonas solaris]